MNEVPHFPPLLVNGEHLDQKTFHERYLKTPDEFKAELIGGMVFVASPVRSPHGRYQGLVVEWLGRYRTATPGVEMYDNVTIILGDNSEPQPDACLCLETSCGGQSVIDENEYLVGPPELVVEVAHSSQSFDLFEKRNDYERGGVREYLVLALQDPTVHWFAREKKVLRERALPEDGVLRSLAFPGLWLDAAALLRLDPRGVQRVLEQGVATAEHAAFVQKLERARGE